MAIREVFRVIIEFFERDRLDYALIGAFALYGFGYVRATRDIDFVTRLQNRNAIRSFLEKLGFETTHCSTAFSNHVHPVGGLRVDVMYVDGPTADRIFSSTTRKTVLDTIEIPVVSSEHLVAMKLFAAASNPDRTLKDLSDVREIVKRTGMNRDILKRYCEKYGLERYYDDLAR